MILLAPLLIIVDFGLRCALPGFPSALSLIEAIIAFGLMTWGPRSLATCVGLAFELAAFIAAATWSRRRKNLR